MSRPLSVTARLWDLPRRSAWFIGAAILALAIPAMAQEGPDVMRVEEDWKLILNEPNDGAYSPQFHTVMSPYAHLDSFYSQVTWNYKAEGGFASGGLQFQNWVDGALHRINNFRTESLSTSAETITWTQKLRVYSYAIRFSVIYGQSATWGEFGNYLLDANVGIENLNNYDTEASVNNSCITYGSNRVDLLVITEVRRYDNSGNIISVDTNPYVVFQIEEQEEE